MVKNLFTFFGFRVVRFARLFARVPGLDLVYYSMIMEVSKSKGALMKRLHVHVGVKDLAASVRFYSTLFGVAPAKIEQDYAKWMLEDPRVNFAISARGAEGVDHLGIQTEDRAELGLLAAQLKSAGEHTRDETATNCCYATSDKSWVRDPDGLLWETFYTFGEATTYGEVAAAPKLEARPAPAACCG
jgi:catechol 2,3-dioxygenase-like lactoylglutathione lyase family enzyme